LGKGIQQITELPLNNAGGQPDIGEKSPAVAGGDRSLSREHLEKQVETLNKFVQSSNTHLRFTLHEKLNEYFVQIVDDQTNEVVREVPSKKILDFVAKIHEMIGILIDEKR
jgi:flagellar protein FlaG